MRKESATIRKCHSRLSSLGLDSTVAFHKSKLILKIYRDVVWVLSERAQELQEYAWELGDQDLSTGLCYLENFAPDIDLQDFEEKVCCVIQSQMLVDVINRALLRLKRYPDRGELYYEILSKQFIYRFNSTEKELLDELNMLCNEKYIGDALLQKTYIADLFTREKRINNGELPKYYVHDCHPAIIDRGTFQKVQEELARRSSLKKTSSKAKTQLGKYCGKYVLSELLVCGECGSPYRRVIWTQKGVKRVVWRCQNRLEHGRKICKHSPTLDEGDIHDAVIFAMNELFQTQVARNAVKASISAVLAGEEQTLSLPAVELQIRNLQERQLELFQLIVSAGADCTDYDEELRQVNMAKTKLMAKKAELEKEQRGAAAFEERLAELDVELEQSCGALTDFDELTVRQLVSNIKVLDKDSLLICFKDGTEITQAMQRRQTA